MYITVLVLKIRPPLFELLIRLLSLLVLQDTVVDLFLGSIHAYDLESIQYAKPLLVTQTLIF